MVDFAVRTTLPAVRIRVEIPHYVFMNLLLEIDSDRPIAANHFVGADAGVCGDVPARVRNTNVVGDISDRMMRTLDSGCGESAEEFLLRV
jgi:hypothetical protein